jgi:hypothetical protein
MDFADSQGNASDAMSLLRSAESASAAVASDLAGPKKVWFWAVTGTGFVVGGGSEGSGSKFCCELRVGGQAGRSRIVPQLKPAPKTVRTMGVVAAGLAACHSEAAMRRDAEEVLP